eukprot:1318598-Amorphochlora_amoeboformis.AAC.1
MEISKEQPYIHPAFLEQDKFLDNKKKESVEIDKNSCRVPAEFRGHLKSVIDVSIEKLLHNGGYLLSKSRVSQTPASRSRRARSLGARLSLSVSKESQ